MVFQLHKGEHGNQTFSPLLLENKQQLSLTQKTKTASTTTTHSCMQSLEPNYKGDVLIFLDDSVLCVNIIISVVATPTEQWFSHLRPLHLIFFRK